MDWPTFGKAAREDFEFAVCHSENGWRDHSGLGASFRHENVYSAVVEKNGILNLFSGAVSFRDIVARDGDALFAVLWSVSEGWSLVSDGKEIALLQSSVIQTLADEPGDARTYLENVFKAAAVKKPLADFVDENLVVGDRAYFAYHKTDEYGPFSGGYFYSNQKRSSGSHLYVVSKKAGNYFLEGIFSVSEVYDGVENPLGKRYSLRLYEIDRPREPTPIGHLFDEHYLRQKVSGRFVFLSVSEKDQATLKDLLNEINQVPLSDDDYVRAIDENLELDRLTMAKVRREQSYIRNQLFKDNKYLECIVCREMTPVQLLVAAHIRKRSECDNAMKLDYLNNVFPICKMGCDELFERGFIAVNSEGRFERLWQEPLVGRVEDYVVSIVGRECPVHNEGSLTYFDWHFNYHSRAG